MKPTVSLQLTSSIEELRAMRHEWYQHGERIAFVPTMGALHSGHLSLIEHARRIADRVIVSIFVNPLQFGPNEDYHRYPRDLNGDIEKIRTHGMTDVVFTPDIQDIYPNGKEMHTLVTVPYLTQDLCALTRPSFFAGVATIVTKLFNLVAPTDAVFGEKDYQQLQVVKALVKDLGLPIRVHESQTVREADGLALSSRNQYLSREERQTAPLLYQTLCQMRDAIQQGQAHAEVIEGAKARLHSANIQVDYLTIRCQNTLLIPTSAETSLIILGAVWLNQTRLIDNLKVM